MTKSAIFGFTWTTTHSFSLSWIDSGTFVSDLIFWKIFLLTTEFVNALFLLVYYSPSSLLFCVKLQLLSIQPLDRSLTQRTTLTIAELRKELCHKKGRYGILGYCIMMVHFLDLNVESQEKARKSKGKFHSIHKWRNIVIWIG